MESQNTILETSLNVEEITLSTSISEIIAFDNTLVLSFHLHDGSVHDHEITDVQ